jgi:hypothetical protein
MSANKTSAVADQEPIDVLVALHPKFDLMDFAGPVEVFGHAAHDFNNDCTLLPPGPPPSCINSP